MKKVDSIAIRLENICEGLALYIDARSGATIFDATDDPELFHEPFCQLVEGCFYDYTFSSVDYCLGDVRGQIVQPHTRNKHTGTLAPNIYVGTLKLPVLKVGCNEPVAYIELEVQSKKAGYRNDYRDMLEFITQQSTDLLLEAEAPVSHHFETDYTHNASQEVLYQRFAFIRSVIGADEFTEAVHRIVNAPVTRWTELTEQRDVRQAGRYSGRNIREFVKQGKRSPLPETHFLREYGLGRLPDRITTSRKTDSVDTPENRFVKHALGTFLKFCSDIHRVAQEDGTLHKETSLLIQDLESHLQHSIFRHISRPETLRLNSPVLQRKEGYREVLRVWLMFDLAAKLVWKGGDDVYQAGKKDVATLYEYWLFFKLLELFRSVFRIESECVKQLFEPTSGYLNLNLKQGRHIPMEGVYDTGNRKLNVRFSYNRSFGGKKSYPDAGSWTTTLRPDYTLSLWPFGISEIEAEAQELIVHIHFDAKYKVAKLKDLIYEETEQQLDFEKSENRKGIYKNADLLKMHAYKDAIRRTGGAYVLYPGTEPFTRKGFHEIIPGLGAFPVRPSRQDDGISDLKQFIYEVIEHFITRTSQREKLAYRTFDIHKDVPNRSEQVKELLPEAYGANRALLPDETHVIIGYYRDSVHLEWIQQKMKYNIRSGNDYRITPELSGARYLLLYTSGDRESGLLYRINTEGSQIFSASELLIKLNYPKKPTASAYLVFGLEDPDPEFHGRKWKIPKNIRSTLKKTPVPVTLSWLMNHLAD